MDRNEFLDKVMRIMEERLGEGYEVKREETLKNNGVRESGILVRKGKIGTIFYLDGFLKKGGLQEGDLQACADQLLRTYLETSREGSAYRGMGEGIQSWESIRGNVYPALLPMEENRELLKNLVWKPFLDLAAICIVQFPETEAGIANAKISVQLMGLWRISEEDLWGQAMENLQREYDCRWMHEVIQECVPGIDVEKPENEFRILTNKAKRYGAAGILDRDILRRQSQGKNLYILPSSIHESLLLEDNGMFEQEELDGMVKSINEEQVPEGERLSDHCYYYDYAKDEVRTEK